MAPDHRPATKSRPASADASDIPAPACHEVLANLWDYLDGNCGAVLAEQVEAHVDTCVVCRRFSEFQQQLFASLAGLREQRAAPRHLHDRVRKALAAEALESRRKERE